MSSHPWAIYPIPIAWLPRAGLQGLGGTVWATTGGNPGGCPLLSTGSTGVPPPGTSSGWASTGAELRRPAQGLRVSLGLGHRDHLNPTRPGPPARSLKSPPSFSGYLKPLTIPHFGEDEGGCSPRGPPSPAAPALCLTPQNPTGCVFPSLSTQKGFPSCPFSSILNSLFPFPLGMMAKGL